ncbi:MAG: hypothetical protein WBD20_18230 [Pirellulaceae bacterium]
MGVILVVGSRHVRGDDLVSGGRFYKQLATPMTLVIDGKPFRETLEQVAAQGRVNVWLDRHVDPSAVIAAGQLGPNVFGALQTVAQQNNCVIMPVANVVLVGRGDWVDAAAAAIIPVSNSLPREDFDWEQLTTPREVLASVMKTSPEKTLALPHDLWPAVKLQGVQSPVVLNLILSQFGRRLDSTTEPNLKRTLPLSSKDKVTRRYTQDDLFRAALKTLDDPPALRPGNGAVALTMTASEHRELTAAIFASAGNKAPKRDLDKGGLELKIDDAPAIAVLGQLAGVAQMKCIVVLAADADSKKFISLDVKDKSLRELIELVAEQAALKVQWGKEDFTLLPAL